ncbi:MAG: HD domain-containing protein [Planctomycetaceae bacterium]|nr:HD domain-containing protein [Planctomycetaceae bacterium]
MPRRYVNQLAHQEPVRQAFIAGDKQLRPNRNGNLYLQVALSDRTGSIASRFWNAGEAIYQSFDNGDYVFVEGTAQLYQGAMQILGTKLRKLDPSEVDPADFTPEPPVAVDRLTVRLCEMLRSMTDPALKTLAECFLMDEPLMAKLSMAPAGTKNHHAFHGGLLEHTVNVMDVVTRVAPCYPQIDRDLLLFGAFLHDLGKVDELRYDRELTYTDQGQLVGHLVLAVALLDQKSIEAEKLSGEPMPDETIVRLKHMILSHHGEYAFGSPKLPMTLEAVALCQLDNLDAKINTFTQLMREDPNTDSPWTLFNANLGRKLFKGQGERRKAEGSTEGQEPH